MANIPTRLYRLLEDFLDIPSLLPMFRERNLLMNDDVLTLSRMWTNGQRKSAIGDLLVILPRKHPAWIEELYCILEASVHEGGADVHRGHCYILEKWDESSGLSDAPSSVSGRIAHSEMQLLREEVKMLKERVKSLEEDRAALSINAFSAVSPQAHPKKKTAPTVPEMFLEHTVFLDSKLVELQNPPKDKVLLFLPVKQILQRIKMVVSLGHYIKNQCEVEGLMIEKGLQTSLAQIDIATKAFKLSIDRMKGMSLDQVAYVIQSVRIALFELTTNARVATDLLWSKEDLPPSL